ncbi:hypothetical protein LCGC14_0961570 [marine sediment metagenome]|uniref:ABC-2 type transporter domain-containing protein n=1 Tax=marine sediment metagenome TaxID=412755 RepID=A0A0F9P0H9_9ZZZZ|nr:hypothetical protein [bacterium]
MKRERKTQSSLFYEKRLFLFYLKKNILSVKFIVCVILNLITIFQILDGIEYRVINYNQRELDLWIFWGGLIRPGNIVVSLTSVIIAADIVSGEFSNKTAMIIYATESKYKILTIKSLTLIISIFILVIFSFSAYLLILFFNTNLFISIHFFLMGFLLVFIEAIFYSSLTFMASALTRRITLSFIFPFFYMIIDPLLESYELGLLSFNSYALKVFNFFENLLFYETIDLNIVTIFCLIMFFGVSIMIMLITFYSFNQLDIRID